MYTDHTQIPTSNFSIFVKEKFIRIQNYKNNIEHKQGTKQNNYRK